ncbi:ATP-grasp fold amidoligase family protein [Caulobacter sp. 17J80-11]|uniref:ATP-grasp fold amidoligase family protein n=1 Tax=Caulobacter sp. 17J80-11 TaxID=2763502 RepID=UPI0016534690|nr:ATP-grasp fold amidoligase family protein [Caulobacter sp. 17J80-11]MBC6982477.1 hypothetical protein [Caulobacter sp. 17J80-11]
MAQSLTKSWLKRLLRPVPDAIYLRARFLARHGHWPNFKSPASFSELVVSRMMYARDPLMPVTADKHLVRDFVREHVGDRYLADVFAVSEGVDRALFDSLPSAFVMKGTHGSKMVRLVTDKSAVTAEELDQEGRSWLARDYSDDCREWVYNRIQPKLIFEELLVSPGHPVPPDFKFYVFNGRVGMIHVDSDRFGGHSRTFYDRDWNRFPVSLCVPAGPDFDKPEALAEMIEVAEKLGRAFEFARVDLYSVGDRIVFGEITHFPGSGNERFTPQSFDQEIFEKFCRAA